MPEIGRLHRVSVSEILPMQKTIFLLCLFLAYAAPRYSLAAPDDLKPFTAESTVSDFALECQQPVKKSHGPQRVSLCITYINSAVQQIALAKRSPECWAELEAGKAAPGPIMDALFYSATQREQRLRPLADELRSIVVEVAAKACK